MFRRVKYGEEAPRGFGFVTEDYARNELVTCLIPLNWPARWIWRLYLKLVHGPRTGGELETRIELKHYRDRCRTLEQDVHCYKAAIDQLTEELAFAGGGNRTPSKPKAPRLRP